MKTVNTPTKPIIDTQILAVIPGIETLEGGWIHTAIIRFKN